MLSLSKNDISAENWRMRYFYGIRISTFSRISYQVKYSSR